uniref:Uncharacterized protein n=1 Tax=Timema monikensis TaxID=170555 RepID=A0A7R9E5Z0_9NEOP|nr:unnamed protein product [Timema monikensis]
MWRPTACLSTNDADVKTVSYKNGEIKPPPNSNTLLIITPISDLDKCGNFLDNKSIFVLARGSNKEIPKINHGLVLVMEQQFDGEKLLLLRKAIPAPTSTLVPWAQVKPQLVLGEPNDLAPVTS